jgi:hypothetical protein
VDCARQANLVRAIDWAYQSSLIVLLEKLNGILILMAVAVEN